MVLVAIARGLPPMGRETLQLLDKLGAGKPSTVAKVRAAIDRLARQNLVSRAAGGPVTVDDPLLAEYLRSTAMPA